MATAEELVQGQLDAYNDHDLERFLSFFSDDVSVCQPPNGAVVLEGKEAFGAFYASERFNQTGLHAALLNRMVLGNKVFDHELITGIGDEAVEAVVCFEVRDGLIFRMTGFRP